MQIYGIMLKITLVTCGIVALSVALLCVRILFERNGKFGASHVGGSAELRQKGIHCVQSMDAIERRENINRVRERR